MSIIIMKIFTCALTLLILLLTPISNAAKKTEVQPPAIKAKLILMRSELNILRGKMLGEISGGFQANLRSQENRIRQNFNAWFGPKTYASQDRSSSPSGRFYDNLEKVKKLDSEIRQSIDLLFSTSNDRQAWIENELSRIEAEVSYYSSAAGLVSAHNTSVSSLENETHWAGIHKGRNYRASQTYTYTASDSDYLENINRLTELLNEVLRMSDLPDFTIKDVEQYRKRHKISKSDSKHCEALLF